VRKTFRQNFGEDMAEFIEFYEPDNYLYHSSVAENILFGDPLDDAFNAENLPQNEIFNEFLLEAELKGPLLDAGLSLIEELIKFSDQQLSDQAILKFGLIDPEEIDDYKRLCYKVKKKGIQKTSRKEYAQILRLVLNFIPQRHPFFHLPKKFKHQIVEGRTLKRDRIMIL
jgi:hypothetical protein